MQEANSTYDWPAGIAEILFVTSIIWAVSIVEMLACDRSLTHNSTTVWYLECHKLSSPINLIDTSLC